MKRVTSRIKPPLQECDDDDGWVWELNAATVHRWSAGENAHRPRFRSKSSACVIAANQKKKISHIQLNPFWTNVKTKGLSRVRRGDRGKMRTGLWVFGRCSHLPGLVLVNYHRRWLILLKSFNFPLAPRDGNLCPVLLSARSLDDLWSAESRSPFFRAEQWRNSSNP